VLQSAFARLTGQAERARTVVNADLNAPGLALMRTFDVVDQLSRVECPTLVCRVRGEHRRR
jgi:hypothetical protein